MGVVMGVKNKIVKISVVRGVSNQGYYKKSTRPRGNSRLGE